MEFELRGARSPCFPELCHNSSLFCLLSSVQCAGALQSAFHPLGLAELLQLSHEVEPMIDAVFTNEEMSLRGEGTYPKSQVNKLWGQAFNPNPSEPQAQHHCVCCRVSWTGNRESGASLWARSSLAPLLCAGDSLPQPAPRVLSPGPCPPLRAVYLWGESGRR